MKSFVKLVGIELEGGWKKKNPSCPLTSDISVKIKTDAEAQTWKHHGEATSPPLEPSEVEKFIRDNYPTAGVNITCGLHVHVSFKDRGIYEKTVSEKFFEFFYEKLERFQTEKHPTHQSFLLRIQGKPPHGDNCKKECCIGRFCKRIYQPFAQMQLKEKDHNETALRRTGINWCYGILEKNGKQRKTVEIRILPMFEKVDDAVEAVKVVIGIFNAFLGRAEREKEQKVKGSIRVVGGEFVGKEEAA